MLFLGWVFVVGGIIQGIDAFRHHRSSGSIILRLLLSILSIVLGILLLTNPLASAASLTLLIGIFFFYRWHLSCLLSL